MNINYDAFYIIIDEVKIKVFLRFSCKRIKERIKETKCRIVRKQDIKLYRYSWNPKKNIHEYFGKIFRGMNQDKMLQYGFDVRVKNIYGLRLLIYYKNLLIYEIVFDVYNWYDWD